MAPDRYRYFRVEGKELLEQLAKGALDLEKGEPNTELVARMLRLAHTLKGAARVVKQREIADLAHNLESVLIPYREGGQSVPRDRIDAILGALDAIGGKLVELPTPGDAVAAVRTSVRTVRTDIAEVDALLEHLSDVYGELAAVRRAVDSAERARQLSGLLAEQVASPRSSDTQRGLQRSASSVARTRALADDLQGVVASLARGLAGSVERIDRELRQAHEAMERLRLIPVDAVFNVLERTARDAALSLGKRIAFEVSGGDVRLDGHVLDIMQGALVQLVRNAVAHGIEAESERVAAGKPAQGMVAIEVIRRGHRVSFICKDDGRGVDLAAVRGAAQRKGVSSGVAARMGVEELLRLLLHGGITTSGTVTELSGRGIGLDVVREAVARLGGETAVHTSAGVGMTIEIRVPVSLASLQALVVETGGQVAAIPLDAVRGAIRVAPHEVTRAPEGDSILHDGKLIPFAALRSALSGRPIEQSRGPISAVIVSGIRATAALAVDRLLGNENIVLRPLPALAPAVAVVAGTYIDSEGNPRLVLDPEVLAAGVRKSRPVADVSPSAPPPILVIDDSMTTRMLEQSILESAGYAVELASSGEEGLEMARRKPYALFLVDIEMPGMDGFGFIERTRADATLRQVPCMLVTSRDAPEDRRRGEQVGALAYVVKSEFDQVEFLDRVARLARR